MFVGPMALMKKTIYVNDILVLRILGDERSFEDRTGIGQEYLVNRKIDKGMISV